MFNYKNNKLIKEKYTLSLLDDNNQQDTTFTNIEVPAKMRINDTRPLTEFKKQVFGGYLKSQVLTALNKDILSDKVDKTVYWSVQLLLSGYVNELWIKLLSIASKEINILNPKLPEFLWKRTQKWYKITSNKKYEKNGVLLLRNNAEIRNLIVEMATVITLSRKRKIEGLPKIHDNDFKMDTFKSKLEAKDTTLTDKILLEDDPTEIRIAINEFTYQLNNRNCHKSLYWLSWMFHWEKLNIKRYKKFEIGCRTISGVNGKWFKQLIWLIWDVINKIRHQTIGFNEAIGKKENQQIDNLWMLYKHEFTSGKKARRVNLIIWAIKYMTSPIDWKIKLVEREHMLFQSMTNIDLMIANLKSQEQQNNTYDSRKFNIVVRNNYILTQKHKDMMEKQRKIEIEKQKRLIKNKAKKQKINVVSMNKINKLFDLDDKNFQ